MSDFFELIINILTDISFLFVHLYELLGYILGSVFVVGMVYLLIIRPLLGTFFDKGKRLYWLSLIVLLVFALGLGPVMVVELSNRYQTTGLVAGIILYVSVVWLISRPGIKRENLENS